MKRGKRVLKILSICLSIYIIYALMAGVVLFSFLNPEPSPLHKSYEAERFYGEGVSQDGVALIEGRVESGAARINLMENAQESIDISYYTIHQGFASELFFASIIDAADRGVEVRVLLDGLFHNLRNHSKDIIYAFSTHPNIELKFYEPFDALRPWTWNNRLHDKLILVDYEYGMIGGRNIGDKYFSHDGYEGASNDRDVLIINMDKENKEQSVIKQMKNYFNDVWDHEFSKHAVDEITDRQSRLGKEKAMELRKFLADMQKDHSSLFQQEINWDNKVVSTNQILFLHNPLERLVKEPWVWQELTHLIESAEESVIVQSPYVIPNDNMMNFLDMEKNSASEIQIVTNSLAATPNVLAFSGYTKYREKIAKSNAELYEYQGPSESLHAKTFIIDNRLTAIGSFNVDPRSAFLNTEVMVVIDSVAFAEEVSENIKQQIETNSLKVQNDGSYESHPDVEEQQTSYRKRVAVQILSWFNFILEDLL